MSDDAETPTKASEPAEEKEPSLKAKDAHANPKKHGSEVHGAAEGSEAGGEPGEGRTGTGLGSTDS